MEFVPFVWYQVVPTYHQTPSLYPPPPLPPSLEPGSANCQIARLPNLGPPGPPGAVLASPGELSKNIYKRKFCSTVSKNWKNLNPKFLSTREKVQNFCFNFATPSWPLNPRRCASPASAPAHCPPRALAYSFPSPTFAWI